MFTDKAPSPAAAPPDSTTNDNSAWVVQPNYDIVVYLDAVSPAQLAFLEQHAERRQAEAHTAHYQLTRESVYRGLESGTSLDNLLATLRTGAKTDLPQNVEREIREWAGLRKQMTIDQENASDRLPLAGDAREGDGSRFERRPGRRDFMYRRSGCADQGGAEGGLRPATYSHHRLCASAGEMPARRRKWDIDARP